jgi:hypothetical protein
MGKVYNTLQIHHILDTGNGAVEPLYCSKITVRKALILV